MRRAALSVLLTLLVFAVFSGLSRTGVRVQSRARQSTTFERQRDARSALQVRQRWRHADGLGARHSSSHSHSSVARNSAGRERLDDEHEVRQSRTGADGEEAAGGARELPDSMPPGPRLSRSARLGHRAVRVPRVRAAHSASNELELPRQRQPQPHERNSDSASASDVADAMRNWQARAAHFQDFQLGMGPW